MWWLIKAASSGCRELGWEAAKPAPSPQPCKGNNRQEEEKAMNDIDDICSYNS